MVPPGASRGTSIAEGVGGVVALDREQDQREVAAQPTRA